MARFILYDFVARLSCILLVTLPFGVRAGEYFDLSYSLNNETIFYPGQKVDFVLNKDTASFKEEGYWYASYSFCMGEHGGTHVDAPLHFRKDGWTLDEIPPSHLVDVPATLVNVESKVFGLEFPSSFKLSVGDLIEHESVHGRIPSKGLILLHTGWGRYWQDKAKYLGWNNSTASTEPVLNFPGVSAEAAKWLANERGIVGFGIDTASVDVGDNKGDLSVHIIFAQRQIYNIENLANLHLILKATNLLDRGNRDWCNLHSFVLPIKITGVTGGPARVLAYCK